MEQPPINKTTLYELVAGIRIIFFDFDGVFTDNTVYVNQRGEEIVRCWRSDGIGLRILDRIGVEYLVISTEKNPVVALRCAKLGIKCRQGCNNKKDVLWEELKRKKYLIEQAAFVGNDINDRECLETVGLPIVVGDAHPDVKDIALYVTNKTGGFGAVREVCDLFASIIKK